jgi:hypothetical protein
VAALESTGDAAAKAALHAAAAQLTTATAQSLWVAPSEAVPPSEGETVFTASSSASNELSSLRHDHTVSPEALLAARNEILEAQLDLARSAEGQVPGAHTPPGASPLKKWEDAYAALGERTTNAATSVAQSTVEQAANNYLSSETSELFAAPEAITGEPLTAKGRPEFFYYGAEGCPFCAVDRWSMVVALAQFGTFSPLGLTVSATSDIDPSTHSFSFYNSNFHSHYMAFVPVEGFTNQPGPFTCGHETFELWTTLQAPTPGQQEIILRYDGFEGCFRGVPFLDVANKWSTIGSYPNPAVIGGLSWQQVAAKLAEPNSAAGQAIDGGAEIITAQICNVDGGQPASICATSTVRRYQEIFTP